MPYKERRIWYFQCTGCGKKRRKSHTRARAKEAICATCIQSRSMETQQTLFDTEEGVREIRQSGTTTL